MNITNINFEEKVQNLVVVVAVPVVDAKAHYFRYHIYEEHCHSIFTFARS